MCEALSLPMFQILTFSSYWSIYSAQRTQGQGQEVFLENILFHVPAFDLSNLLCSLLLLMAQWVRYLVTVPFILFLHKQWNLSS